MDRTDPLDWHNRANLLYQWEERTRYVEKLPTLNLIALVVSRNEDDRLSWMMTLTEILALKEQSDDYFFGHSDLTFLPRQPRR